jgi:hypothetical protein
VLAEGIEVSGAALENGLLHVTLTRPEPATVSRTIEIKEGEIKTGGEPASDLKPGAPRVAGRGQAA